jgi:hypothetical protein
MNIKIGDFGFARLCVAEDGVTKIMSQTFCGSSE